MSANQPFKEEIARFQHERRENSTQSVSRVGETIPVLISKKWLYCHFEISRTNVNRLYHLVLTTQVLEQLDLTIEDVRKRGFQTFNATQSKTLIKILFE